jgi:hypothetical protein
MKTCTCYCTYLKLNVCQIKEYFEQEMNCYAQYSFSTSLMKLDDVHTFLNFCTDTCCSHQSHLKLQNFNDPFVVVDDALLSCQ